ncbi:M12 family metallo-peptidase [Sandaracinobacteroides saxicola]|uniref:Peptidyl-Asp metalloendopeptidase n=1 Tax=Sandaracinobacteroides saxicola TaxID=2759707 RepID=A0A7G5IHT8_9SPHN|nr:M12 family metallo-peptidase [Sandaracinobacteroides saxicola]QMW22930.1 hypothetical protein H3309_16830 [Sandaracinobacteroides saxicola]
MIRFLTLVCAIAASIATPLSAQPRPGLLVTDQAALSPATRTQLQRKLAVSRVDLVRINTATLANAAPRSVVDLALTPQLRFAGVTREVRALDGGRRLWRGALLAADANLAGEMASPTLPQGDATLVVSGSSVTGTIVAPNGDRFRVRPVGDGRNAVIRLDYAKLPPEHEADSDRKRASPLKTGPQADRQGDTQSDTAGDAAPVIDVMVAWTSAAATAAGDIASVVDLAVQETNDSFANSAVTPRIRLAGTMASTFSESGKSYATINDESVTNAGLIARRDELGADVVVLLVDKSSACGRAADIGAAADRAFVAVHWDCATGNYSFGHEIGHIAGARHDRDQDDSTAPFAFGHGFLKKKPTGGWRTIMGYRCEDGSCPTRIQYWSNPGVNYLGEATGTAANENNARVWNERGATLAGFRSAPAAVPYSGTLYQLHSSGRIWQSLGTSCAGNSCPGWRMLDNNPATRAISASTSNLFQLHSNGRIWRWLGAACSGNSCPSWQMIDNNPATRTIVAAGFSLYQLHNGGRIWRWQGTPCAGNSCPGWTMLDNNPATVAIAASGTNLYQLHNNGRIWRFTGTACSGNSCPGWQMIDNNPATTAIVANGGQLWQLHNSGRIWRFTGTACSGNSCPGWQMIDNNPATRSLMASGGNLFQRHSTGRIWRWQGSPCSGNSCPSWVMLDNNPATAAIAGDGSALFQRHGNGRLWVSTGVPCTGNSCPGWRMIDNNPATVAISAPAP